jgi:uncharacterized protein YfdQ (DUF2303 family)
MANSITLNEQVDAATIEEANLKLTNAVSAVFPAVALPNSFTLHSLERFYESRIIPRGALKLSLIDDFVTAVKSGHTVFIDREAIAQRHILTKNPPNKGSGTIRTA